jgi:hypothetical protein
VATVAFDCDGEELVEIPTSEFYSVYPSRTRKRNEVSPMRRSYDWMGLWENGRNAVDFQRMNLGRGQFAVAQAQHAVAAVGKVEVVGD